MSDYQPRRKTGMGIGKLMLYTALLCFAALFFYKYYTGQSIGSIGDSIANYTMVPKEMQINYVPADFKMELDEEYALSILSNPYRYSREFNELIYKFNLSMLNHVATRMNLPDSLKMELEPSYKVHHDYLKDLYFKDFVALKDTSDNIYQAWYENEATSSAEILNEVASKYTCFLVNHVIMSMVKSEGGKLNVKGSKIDSPCGIAMTEAMRPLMKRLQKRAAIEDFTRSKGMMEEKIEAVIAELATMEVRDKKGLNKQLQTKVLGYAVSSTDIEVSAISILKVGFKLDKFFDLALDPKKNIVRITLPEPTILSHEVFPKVDKLDIGWLRELSNVDLNKNFNLLRGEFRREALESNIMEKSKEQAKTLMEMMIGPVVHSLNNRFKLEVGFHRMSPTDGINMDIGSLK